MKKVHALYFIRMIGKIPERWRDLAEEKLELVCGAEELFVAVEKIKDREELEGRLSGSGWQYLHGNQSVSFVEDDRCFEVRRVVSLEGARTVRIRDYEATVHAKMPPERKDAYLTMWGIFPAYEGGNPVFDELAVLGRESFLPVDEAIGVIQELVTILT